MGKRYQHYQPNKKDLPDKSGDCVIRALTKVTGKSWLDVFDELVPIARELQCMPDHAPCMAEFLKRNGFLYCRIKEKKIENRPTVEKFAGRHRTGTYVVCIAHHVTAVVGGQFHDVWDCGRKPIYGYWWKR